MDILETRLYFSSAVSWIKKMDFLNQIRSLSDLLISQIDSSKEKMTVMTGDFSGYEDAKEFGEYVSQTVWNILESQGYMMEDKVTYFTEMWTQEHHYQSSIDPHIHGSGVQMSVFYFLDVPENSSVIVFHDPRPAKVIINLPEKDMGQITPASNSISLKPEDGLLMFVPPYVAHEITRNMNKDKPFRFVHMNLSVMQSPVKNQIKTVII
jgi:hypothetical protein